MRGCVRTRDRIAKPRWRWVRIGHAKRTSELSTWEMCLKKVIVKKTIDDVGCSDGEVSWSRTSGMEIEERGLWFCFLLCKKKNVGDLTKPWLRANLCDYDEVKNTDPPTPCK